MDAPLQRALSLVLADEGGFVDDPRDPGGATNHGVTLATYRALMKPGATVADLKNISQAKLATIYRDHFWNAVRADDLPAGVDYAVFDYAVNSGPNRAAKALQSVVGAATDGKIGPLALVAVARKPPAATITLICNSRLVFLETLPTWDHFGKGWAARVARVQAAALKMVA